MERRMNILEEYGSFNDCRGQRVKITAASWTNDNGSAGPAMIDIRRFTLSGKPLRGIRFTAEDAAKLENLLSKLVDKNII